MPKELIYFLTISIIFVVTLEIELIVAKLVWPRTHEAYLRLDTGTRSIFITIAVFATTIVTLTLAFFLEH